MRKKLSLTAKILIVLSTLGVATGATIGGMVAYANNSDEVKGRISPANRRDFSNDYSKIYLNGNKADGLVPTLAVLDPNKANKVANVNESASEFSFVDQPNTKYNFRDFFKEYFRRYNESFILQVKYGSFSFYNEYVLAVHPDVFIDFTKWFINNVAWGPDLLTLESFRIVPGVVQNGNSLTLGSHSTLNKEVSEIKFYPDAFFGSMPIYSISSGAGNATDNLTYKIFDDTTDKTTVDQFLSNIPLSTTLKNLRQLVQQDGSTTNILSFEDIFDPSRLLNQSFLVNIPTLASTSNADSSDSSSDSSSQTNASQPRNYYIFNDSLTSEEFTKLQQANPSEYANLSYANLTRATVDYVEVTSLNTMSVDFVYKGADGSDQHYLVDFDKTILERQVNINSLSALHNALIQTLHHAADLYDLQNYVSKPEQLKLIQPFQDQRRRRQTIQAFFASKNASDYYATKNNSTDADRSLISPYHLVDVYAFVNDDKTFKFYPTYERAYADNIGKLGKVPAVDSPEYQAYLSKVETFKNQIKHLYVTDLSYANQQLSITAVDTDAIDNQTTPSSEQTYTKTYDLSDLNKVFDDFTNLKRALQYKGAINPISLSFTPEDLFKTDENGNKITGLAARQYQIFAEAYNGIYDTIVHKFPELLKTKEGPHIVRKLNNQGFYEYTIEDGPYKGFTPDDRVGLPILLDATIDNYEGISADFLKYVGAHEYGHHYTLENSQNLDNANSSVVVGGISVRGGVSINSYYSFQALKNYLAARSTLDVYKTDPFGKEDPKGTLIRFKYLQPDGTWYTETDNDIWGNANPNASSISVLSNPRRRFLQDYKGLQEAAKLRNTTLNDLFLANSLDDNSATLNPFIAGDAKVLDKKVNADNSISWVFEKANRAKLLSEFKDGLGNPLVFDANNNVKLVEFKTDENGQPTNEIASYVMFNKDGSPVVQLPLNTPLDSTSLNYINNLATNITNNINQLIITQFTDSGWNNASTKLNVDFNSEVARSSFVTTPDPFYISEIQNRNSVPISLRNNLFDLSTFNSDNPQLSRNSFNETFYEKGNRLGFSAQIFSLLRSLRFQSFFDLITVPDKSDARFGRLSLNQFRELTFVQQNQQPADSSSDSSANTRPTYSRISPADSYVFPFKSTSLFAQNMYPELLDPTLAPGYDQVQRIWNGFRQTLIDNFSTNLTGQRAEYSFEVAFARSLGINVLTQIGTPQYDSDFTTDNSQIFNITSVTRGSDNNLVFGALLPNQLDITSRTPIAPNNYVVSYNAKNQTIAQDLAKFYNSLGGTNRSVEINYGSADAPDNQTNIVFSDLSDLIEFGTVDYTKANVTQDSFGYAINWDIDYVKTKVNLDKFKEGILANEANKPQTAQITASEQSLANEFMKRFINSSLFIGAKNFNPATDLLNNQAILDPVYGLDLINPLLQKQVSISNVAQVSDPTLISPTDIQNAIQKYFTGAGLSVEELANLNANDLFLFLGQYTFFSKNGQFYDDEDFKNLPNLTGFSLNTLRFTNVLSKEPSNDVNNYNTQRIESQLQDKFTDYVYSIAETLTRDYVQTIFVPSQSNLGNLPTYLDNVNERNTGLDYVVDASQLQIWRDNVNSISSIINAIRDAQNNTNNSAIIALDNKYSKLQDQIIADYTTQRSKLPSDQDIQNLPDDQANAVRAQLRDLLSERNKKLDDLDAQKTKERVKILGKLSDSSTLNNRTRDLQSSYFGIVQSKSNGYFKDRWQKEEINSKLYDDNGDQIIDNTIRLKDWNGQVVNSRPKAFFVSQLLNYGVGSRTISGIFRNKSLDALALYGYIKTDLAKKVKYLVFTDTKTNEKKYLKINTNSTNNLFYLTRQADPTSKVTIEDLGYTSWLSDYALMAKYRDTLLSPNHSYTINFADENKNIVEGFTQGNVQVFAENGKDAEQAPVVIQKADNGDSIISVKNQFSIGG